MSNSQSRLQTKTKVRAGALTDNHGLRVRTKTRAGALSANHGLRLR